MNKLSCYFAFIFSIIFFYLCPLNFVQASNSLIPFPDGHTYFGAWTSGPNGEIGDDRIFAFESMIDKELAIIPATWQDNVNFIISDSCCHLKNLNNINATFGAVPLVTLRSDNRTLTEIITNTIHPNDKRSNYMVSPDDFFRSWARGLKAYGKPVFFRPNHEMNGSWYPWSVCDLPNTKPDACRNLDTGQKNTSSEYIQAWRHIHDIFTEEGASNVVWVWEPTVYYDELGVFKAGVSPYTDLYPGDAYVDWLGLDVYNSDDRPWSTFEQLVTNDYNILRGLSSNKPIMIPEFNSTLGDDSTGAKKAAWLKQALTYDLPTLFPYIKAVVFFNFSNPAANYNQQLELSPLTITAFKNSIASQYYLSDIPMNNPTPILSPSPTPISTMVPIPGDYDGNRVVDLADFGVWKKRYLAGPPTMTLVEFGVWKRAYLGN